MHGDVAGPLNMILYTNINQFFVLELVIFVDLFLDCLLFSSSLAFDDSLPLCYTMPVVYSRIILRTQQLFSEALEP